MTGTDRLAFGLYGRRAGVIERIGGRIRLDYDADYIGRPDPTPLSLSLPLAGEPARTARAVNAYLAGLLPDHKNLRDRWSRRHAVRLGDNFGLVAAIGLDCAGGAVFAREDEIVDALASKGHIEPVSRAWIAERLRTLRHDQNAWHEDDEHWSLAGGQGKFTLTRLPDGWGVGSGAVPSTHIVKPGIGWIDGQALAEHVSMRTLALAGLPVAETQFDVFEDQPAIIVARFDRRDDAGRIDRIHQEDMLQALAVMPEHKYEADAGPGVERIARLLRSVAGGDAVARFADAVVANHLLAAPDAHAKNYSVLLAGGQVALAPMYDVSTGLLPRPGGRLFRTGAMSIGGEKRFGDVEAKNWRKFAGIVGQEEDRLLARVSELADVIPRAFAAALDELEPDTPGREALRQVALPLLETINAQTVRGLTGTRRVAGRIYVPFMDTLDPRPEPASEVRWDAPDGAAPPSAAQRGG